MKSFIILSCVVVALCSPRKLSPHHHRHGPRRFLSAIRHEEVRDGTHQYAFRYITAENTVVSESGRLVPSVSGGFVIEIDGHYSFIGDDGRFYTTKYRGGVDGFHVEAAHLPRPVPAVPAVPSVPAVPAPLVSRNKMIL